MALQKAERRRARKENKRRAEERLLMEAEKGSSAEGQEETPPEKHLGEETGAHHLGGELKGEETQERAKVLAVS